MYLYQLQVDNKLHSVSASFSANVVQQCHWGRILKILAYSISGIIHGVYRQGNSIHGICTQVYRQISHNTIPLHVPLSEYPGYSLWRNNHQSHERKKKTLGAINKLFSLNLDFSCCITFKPITANVSYCDHMEWHRKT